MTGTFAQHLTSPASPLRNSHFERSVVTWSAIGAAHLEQGQLTISSPFTVNHQHLRVLRPPTAILTRHGFRALLPLAPRLRTPNPPRPHLLPPTFRLQPLTMSTLKRKAAPGAGPDAKKPKQNGTLTSFFTAPKGAAAAPPAPKFNKEKWAAGLSDEQRQLLKLEIDTMDESWLSVLKDEIVTKEFLELKRFLDREDKAGKKVFPPKEDIYSW